MVDFINADFHVHTHFSTDSSEMPDNYVDLAIKKGFKHICFTDHNDYDFPLLDGEIAFQLDFPSYYEYMKALQEKYKKDINIHIGVEQGLMVCAKDKINNFDPEKKYDFIIGSSHLIDGADPYYPEFWEGKTIQSVIEKYYQSIIDNINVCNNFDVYGHIDYILRYIPKDRLDYNYSWKDYYDYIRTALTMLVERGKGIEINTAGLKYGLNEPNPCTDIVKLYHDLGGEIITVGSDAHKQIHFAYDFHKIPKILETAGFDYFTIFKDRKPEFIKIK